MIGYRHGALAVIETPRDRDEIQRLLREIDDRLFVERQLAYDNKPVWCVVVSVGGDHPPITILEWRDDDNEPIPHLSSGIITRVQRMERDGGRLAATVIEKNRKLIEARRERSRNEYRELGVDADRLMHPLRSGLLHRGVHLRRSRDKLRAQGFKI